MQETNARAIGTKEAALGHPIISNFSPAFVHAPIYARTRKYTHTYTPNHGAYITPEISIFFFFFFFVAAQNRGRKSICVRAARKKSEKPRRSNFSCAARERVINFIAALFLRIFLFLYAHIALYIYLRARDFTSDLPSTRKSSLFTSIG